MRDLKALEINTTVTVTRVSGGREQRKELEKLGVMPGADLTVLGVTETGVRVNNGRSEVELADDLAACVRFSAQFKRNGDPVLMGCCGGNNQAFFEHMEKTWKEPEREKAEAN